MAEGRFEDALVGAVTGAVLVLPPATLLFAFAFVYALIAAAVGGLIGLAVGVVVHNVASRRVLMRQLPTWPQSGPQPR